MSSGFPLSSPSWSRSPSGESRNDIPHRPKP
jgi:hypothetical protein